MPLDVNPTTEWNQYYSETFAFHPETNEVVYLEGFHSNNERYVSVSYNTLSRESNVIKVKSSGMIQDFSEDTHSQKSFMFGFPPPIYINKGKYCYYRPYFANKQWKKSFTYRVTHDDIPYNNDLLYFLPNSVPIKETDMAYWYWHYHMKTGTISYPTYEQCLEDIYNNKCFGKAFSPDWGLRVKVNSQYPVLYYHQHAVGACKDDVILFPRKISNLLTRLNVNSEVILV